ncbi:unnamed protein product [Dicrocoelium dendriticum]|nr:unnamed protein product [Dicrocoelium dendriticum]
MLVNALFLLASTQVNQDAEFLQQFTSNSSTLRWVQRAYIAGGWLDLSQQTQLNLDPIQLISTWSSLKGSARLITTTPYFGGFHLELQHNSCTNINQRDLILRIHQNADNVLHANLHWRPGLLKALFVSVWILCCFRYTSSNFTTI